MPHLKLPRLYLLDPNYAILFLHFYEQFLYKNAFYAFFVCFMHKNNIYGLHLYAMLYDRYKYYK